MNKITRISAAALLLVVACQKTELPENNTTQENPAPEAVLSEEQALIKSMLAKRDTRWTVDELDIPEVSGEWNLIANEKELAFLLEFGCAEGGKYRLENDLNLASSEIAEKFTSEIGIEKFVNFEFDGNDKTISGLNLPIAAGLFSEISGTSKVYDLTLNSFVVGSSENVSNLLGTGLLCGSAKGTLEVSNVRVSNSSVSAPCKVGGMIGSFVDGTASFDGCAVNSTTVEATYLKGISGWCGGFIGFVGRSEEKNTALSVAVETNDCSVNGCTVKARMESDTRFSGKFLGTIVGYDENEVFRMAGCSVSDDTTLSITDANGAAYKSEDPSGLIGGHKYLGGLIYVDGAIYVIPWDGVTVTEPALEGDTYMVYTAAELAWFQGQKVTNKIRICDNINMGKKPFTPILEAVYIDGQKDSQENYEIQNLKITFKHTGDSDGYGGAFINRVKTNNTVHQNLNFRGIDVYVNHYDVVPADLTNAGQYGNGYAATLCSRVNSGMTYKVSNVHCYNGKLNGVCKIGGLLGGSWGTLTVENCSVENYWIENHEVNCLNAYEIKKTKDMGFLGTYEITCYAEFYTEGECGGLIGFIAKNASVTGCSVKDTKMKCFGQRDQSAPIKVNGEKLFTYMIPGRHVNQFIGDIRTQSSSSNDKVTVTITNPTVSGNIYVGSGYMYDKRIDNVELSADSAEATTYDYNHSWSNTSTKYVGSAYYIGADILSMHEGDYKGEVKITQNSTTTSVNVEGGV